MSNCHKVNYNNKTRKQQREKYIILPSNYRSFVIIPFFFHCNFLVLRYNIMIINYIIRMTLKVTLNLARRVLDADCSIGHWDSLLLRGAKHLELLGVTGGIPELFKPPLHCGQKIIFKKLILYVQWNMNIIQSTIFYFIQSRNQLNLLEHF